VDTYQVLERVMRCGSWMYTVTPTISLNALKTQRKYATRARGIYMLRSAMERGANAVILSEIGPPGFRWAVQEGINVFIFHGKVEDAIKAFH
jgi:Uncharacterized conserved protein